MGRVGHGHHHGTGQPLLGALGSPLDSPSSDPYVTARRMSSTWTRTAGHLDLIPCYHSKYFGVILIKATSKKLEPLYSDFKGYQPISLFTGQDITMAFLKRHLSQWVVQSKKKNAFQVSVTSSLTYLLLLSKKFKCRWLPCRQQFYTYFNFVIAQVHFALKPEIYFPFQRESSVVILFYAFLYCRKEE